MVVSTKTGTVKNLGKNNASILIISTCANLHKGGQPFTVLNMAVALARTGSRVFLVTALPSSSKASDELKKEGIVMIHIPMSRIGILSPIQFSLQSLISSFFLIKKQRINICQVHAPSSGLIAFILKSTTGVKLSLFTHGFWRKEKKAIVPSRLHPLKPLFNKSIILYERFLYRNSDFLIVVNDNLTNYLLSFNESYREKIHKLSRCVSLKRFGVSISKKEASLGLSKNSISIVFLGAFDGLRGQEFFIPILPKLVKVFPSIQVFFVGDGLYINEARNSVNSLNVQKNVTFLGHRKDVFSILSYASVCIGYLSPRLDGISNAHLEAIQMKVPLIAKLDPLISNVFGDSLVYVSPEDSDNLLNVVCSLLQNPKYAKERAEEAYRILNKTSWENEAKKLVQFYNNDGFFHDAP